MKSFRSTRGQVLGISVFILMSMLGMTALVLDIGAWFREDRALQQVADAAALAGAQALPESTGEANALAVEYAEHNDGPTPDVSFSSTVVADDTIRVGVSRPIPGFFSRVFGIESVEVGALARARAGYPSSARWVAPIVVDVQHPMVACTPQPCFNQQTEIQLHHLHRPGSGNAAGSFGLISLDNSSVNENTVAGWMLSGYSGMMDLGNYGAVPSTMFNGAHFQQAFRDRLGDELLFPIYRTITGSGSNARYVVIGWIGFVPESVEAEGSDGTLFGYFTRVVWEGIVSETAPANDFGVRAVELIE